MKNLRKVVIFTPVGHHTPWIDITLPNRLEYCMKHNYNMVISCESYDEALENFGKLSNVLSGYDLMWTLDADCLITDLTKKIENISELGPNVTICEEGLGSHALVNGGSIVWKNTPLSHELIAEIEAAKSEWKSLQFNIQQWLMVHHQRLADKLKICPKRTFNSIHYYGTKIWQEGDFVYHPCGMHHELRCQVLRDMQKHIIHD